MWCNQIFSLISPSNNIDTIKNIIVCDNYEVANQIAKQSYGLFAYAVDTTLYPLSIGYKYIDGIFYNLDGDVVKRNLTAEEEAYIARTKAEELEKKISPIINYDTCTLEELKVWQINLSKNNLKEYLNNNPIFSTCHKPDGGYYAITNEKQNQLLAMISVTQMKLFAGIEYQPSWNETGKSCTYDWTLEELMQLSFEIEEVVRPLVSRQQEIEDTINASTTKKDVLAINVEF